MKQPNFNQVIDRHNTSSVKWDFINQKLQLDGSDLLPMWVSDFDFKCPDEVIQALHDRVEHGVFGYSERDDDYYQSVMDWFVSRHQLEIDRDWFTTIEGVVPGLALLVQMLSEPGESVVVQGPYYGSFANVITMNHRVLLENPLLEGIDGYQIDFYHLENLFKTASPKVLILCNPHNPTGRCWRREELIQLLGLCKQYNVIVISDEIWADLTLPGEKYTSVLHLGSEWHDHVIAATSASKTFGLSSLRISNFLIPNSIIRKTFISRLHAHGLDVFNSLSMAAATAAYKYSGHWLDALQVYLAENRRWLKQKLEIVAPWCRMVKAEGTYLAWLDCRALKLNNHELKNILLDKAKIAVSMGDSFGVMGRGYIRLNLGCPREYLEIAVNGLSHLNEFRDESIAKA